MASHSILDRPYGSSARRGWSSSIGTCFGYAIAHYADFYDIDHVLVLGRVTTGEGGEIVIERAREVLMNQFPELAMELHVPDERMKRVGQSVAAASLPELRKGAR